MTNKEHLATLSPTDWFDRVDWLSHSYGKFYVTNGMLENNTNKRV